MKKITLGLVALTAATSTMAQDADQEALLGGNWDLTVKTDAMTDAKVARLIKMGTGGGMIAFKCDEAGPKSVYMHIIGDAYLGGDETRQMMVRFGSEDAVKTMMFAKDRSALVFDFSRTQKFARKMMTVDKVSFRLYSYRYASSDVSFDLEGAATEIPKLFAECGARL